MYIPVLARPLQKCSKKGPKMTKKGHFWTPSGALLAIMANNGFVKIDISAKWTPLLCMHINAPKRVEKSTFFSTFFDPLFSPFFQVLAILAIMVIFNPVSGPPPDPTIQGGSGPVKRVSKSGQKVQKYHFFWSKKTRHFLFILV